MTTIHHLTNKAIAVTGLPEGAEAWMNESYHVNTVWYKAEGMRNPKCFDLPEGNWSILGFSQDLKEEDWKRVVADYGGKLFDYDPKEYPSYTDYETIDHPFDSKFFDNATESGCSLLKSKGLYVENPHKHPIYMGTMGDSVFSELESKWQSAQLISNPLILIQ